MLKDRLYHLLGPAGFSRKWSTTVTFKEAKNGLKNLLKALHGSGQTFARTNFFNLFLYRLFTWIRANSVAVLFTRIRAKFRPVAHLIPGHNRAIWSKMLHGLTRIRTKHGTVPFKKLTYFFQVPNLHSNIRPVPPVPCKLKVEPCNFLSVQQFVRTRANGA